MANELFVIEEDDDGNAKGFALAGIKSFGFEHRSSGGVGVVDILFVSVGESQHTFHGDDAAALYKELKKLAIVV